MYYFFKRMLLLLFVILSFGEVQAQRFAFVDVEFMLRQVPEYQEAQEQLDKTAQKWQEEIDAKKKEVERMYQEYQEEKVLLTEDVRRQKEEAIMQREEEVKALQKKRFGYEGDLFKKRQELVKPIQDRVYEAIETVAKRRRYDFIFDRSAGTTILYAEPSQNKSSDVLREMGISPEEEED